MIEQKLEINVKFEIDGLVIELSDSSEPNADPLSEAFIDREFLLRWLKDSAVVYENEKYSD